MFAFSIFLRMLLVVIVKVQGNVHPQNDISLETVEHNKTALNISIFQLPFQTKKHKICYYSSNLEKLAMFSLVLCKQLGFQGLQRIYSLDKKSSQNSSGKGVAIEVTCNGNETLIDYCDWKSHFISSCNEFLGVECTSCNHSLTLEDGEQNSFELPTSVSCQPPQICEWKITRKSWAKAMRVKFQRGKTSVLQENILQINGEVLEMKWMDNKTVGHTVKLGSEITSGNIVTITIPSDSMSLLYIPSYVCNNIVINKITAVIDEDVSKDYYLDGSNSSQVLIVSSISFLILLSIAIVFLCCERQKWKRHFSPHYKHTSWNCSWSSQYADSTSSQNSKTKREMTYFTSFSSISADTEVAEKDNNGSHFCSITENETNCASSVGSNIVFNSIRNKQMVSNESEGVFDFITDDVSHNRTRKVTYRWNKGNFFSSLRHSILPCFYSRSPRLCSNFVHKKKHSSTRRKQSAELEDSSLESLCSKFNNSVLKLQWSDRSSMSVSELSVKSDTEDRTILELSNKYSDRYINFNFLWKTNTEIQGTNSMSELCSCDSDKTSVHSFKSLESGETFYSMWQHSRPSVAFSESDTFGSLSFECPSPISDVLESSTDTVV